MNTLPRPETFDDALDAYLYFCVDESLARDPKRYRQLESDPSFRNTKEFRDELWRTCIIFAVKERQV